MSVEEQVFICLVWLANGGNYNAAGGSARRSRSSVHRCVKCVCQAIVEHLGNKYVKGWPDDDAELERMALEFEQTCIADDTRGIPNIVGAADGTQFCIKPFAGAGEEFHSYKGLDTVGMHAVVDARGNFLDVEVGWSGRTNDGRMFANSHLFYELWGNPYTGQGGELGQRFTRLGKPIGGEPMSYMIICDAAYECTRYTLPAFKESETHGKAWRSKFNTKVAKTRNSVERAFGRLKNKFRVLLKAIEVSQDVLVHVIRACVVLHNMCQHYKAPDPVADDELDGMLQGYYANLGRTTPLGTHAEPHGETEGRRVRRCVVQQVNTPRHL